MKQKGFTLVELMVTVLIMLVIGAVVLYSLTTRHHTVDLTSTTQAVGGLLRQAQLDAIDQKSGTAWGVHFANPTNTAPFYVLFASSTYSTSTVFGNQYRLPTDVCYSPYSIPAGGSIDVYFNQGTGLPSTSTKILLLQSTQGCNPPGSLSQTWGATSQMPIPHDGGAAFYNGYLYIFGGNTNTTTSYDEYMTSTSLFAPFYQNGTIGSWQYTTPLPVAGWTNAFAIHGKMYVFLVAVVTKSPTSTVASTTVVWATINPNGSLGAWNQTNPLPSTAGGQGQVLYNNNFVYFIGGCDNGCTVPSTTAWYAAVNTSTGAIGTWATTTSLTAGATSLTALSSYNGYIYAVGGGIMTSTLPGSTTVIYSAVNSSTGVLGSWQTGTSLPFPVADQNYAEYNNYYYSISGYSSGTITSTIVYTTINSSTGALGTWKTTTPFPAGISGPIATMDGYVCIVGGDIGDGIITSTVYCNGLDPADGSIVVEPQGTIVY